MIDNFLLFSFRENVTICDEWPNFINFFLKLRGMDKLSMKMKQTDKFHIFFKSKCMHPNTIFVNY